MDDSLKPWTDKGSLRINPLLVLMVVTLCGSEAHSSSSVSFSYDLHQLISGRAERQSSQREESLAFTLSIAVIVVLGFGYYVLSTRFHIRHVPL